MDMMMMIATDPTPDSSPCVRSCLIKILRKEKKIQNMRPRSPIIIRNYRRLGRRINFEILSALLLSLLLWCCWLNNILFISRYCLLITLDAGTHPHLLLTAEKKRDIDEDVLWWFEDLSYSFIQVCSRRSSSSSSSYMIKDSDFRDSLDHITISALFPSNSRSENFRSQCRSLWCRVFSSCVCVEKKRDKNVSSISIQKSSYDIRSSLVSSFAIIISEHIVLVLNDMINNCLGAGGSRQQVDILITAHNSFFWSRSRLCRWVRASVRLAIYGKKTLSGNITSRRWSRDDAKITKTLCAFSRSARSIMPKRCSSLSLSLSPQRVFLLEARKKSIKLKIQFGWINKYINYS